MNTKRGAMTASTPTEDSTMGRSQRAIAASIAALALVAGAVVTLPPIAAHAGTSTATLTYNGTQSGDAILADTGLLYANSGTFPPATGFVPFGEVWFRAQLGVRTKVVTAQTANLSLAGPDSVHQGDTTVFSRTFTAVDSGGNVVTVTAQPYLIVDVAVDLATSVNGQPYGNGDCPPAVPGANVITTQDQLTAAYAGEFKTDADCADTATGNGGPGSVVGTGLDAVYHSPAGGDNLGGVLTLLAQHGLLPYTGAGNFSQSAAAASFDLHDLIDFIPKSLVSLALNLNTSVVLTATGGYGATRSIIDSSNPSVPLVAGPVQFTSSSPQADPVALPCDASVGSALTYGLTGNAWSGTASATVPQGSLGLGFLGGTLNFAVPVDASLFNGVVTAEAGDAGLNAGQVAANDVPPTISSLSQAGSLTEGVATTYSAAATDNCPTALTYTWLFSDGGVAYGANAYHTFLDAASYTGQLQVTDAAGNTNTQDFSTTIADANPTVTAPPAATSVWGVPIQFHTAALDPNLAEQSSLQVGWTFGDGATASGADVSHAYAAPGTYTVSLTATDPDGGSATTTTSAVVTARPTTVNYTGPLTTKPNKKVVLTAVLTDSAGTPLAGRVIVFTVGSQTVSALTSSTGLASVTLTLKQKTGSYQLSAHYAPSSADSVYYLGSISSTTFKIS
jgi:PKD repeat protein